MDFASHTSDQVGEEESTMTNNNTPTLGPSRGDEVLDYASSEGIKSYKRATAALKDDYNGKSEGIAVFQMQLSDHALTEGWANKSAGDIINIPKDGADANNGVVNIIKNHTQIGLAALKTWAMNNLFGSVVNRKMQNNENMKKCLFATITKECMVDINLKESEYTVNDVIIAPLLYKTIMANAELDTMVTSAAIRLDLQQLEAKMIELQSNVKDFVEFVQRAIKKLKARGGTINEEDLALNLMKAMKIVKDKSFREHFQRLDFEWMAGKQTVTAESILTEADTFYRVKVQNNTWGELSQEEEKIVAMEATFKDLNLRLEQANKRAKRRRDSNESNNDGNKSKSQGSRNVPKWKLENPDKAKKIKKQGKTYYWCPRHNDEKGMWVLHKPDQCRNKPRDAKTESSADQESKEDRNDSEQAMPAIKEREDESVASSSSEESA